MQLPRSKKTTAERKKQHFFRSRVRPHGFARNTNSCKATIVFDRRRGPIAACCNKRRYHFTKLTWYSTDAADWSFHRSPYQNKQKKRKKKINAPFPNPVNAAWINGIGFSPCPTHMLNEICSRMAATTMLYIPPPAQSTSQLFSQPPR